MSKLFEKTVVSQETFAKQVKELLTNQADFLAKKNADYGGASMDLGMTGNFVHIWDKVKRLESLLELRAAGKTPNFEGMEDTLKDIIGYATIGLVIMGPDKVEIRANDQDCPPPSTPDQNQIQFLESLAFSHFDQFLWWLLNKGSTDPVVFGQVVQKRLLQFLKKHTDAKYVREVGIGLGLTEE